jgi:hypothetical protein
MELHCTLQLAAKELALLEARVTRGNRMAYSPRLWLMAIGW